MTKGMGGTMFEADKKQFATAEAMAEYILENVTTDYYDDMIDECYPEIEIMGLTYAPSIALYRIDPIAYDVYFTDYKDGLRSDIIYDLNRMIDDEEETYYNTEVKYIEDDED